MPTNPYEPPQSVEEVPSKVTASKWSLSRIIVVALSVPMVALVAVLAFNAGAWLVLLSIPPEKRMDPANDIGPIATGFAVSLIAVVLTLVGIMRLSRSLAIK